MFYCSIKYVEFIFILAFVVSALCLCGAALAYSPVSNTRVDVVVDSHVSQVKASPNATVPKSTQNNPNNPSTQNLSVAANQVKASPNATVPKSTQNNPNNPQNLSVAANQVKASPNATVPKSTQNNPNNPSTQITAVTDSSNEPIPFNGTTNSNITQIDFEAIPNGNTTTTTNTAFECKIDKSQFSPCSKGVLHLGLEDGMHSFIVKAIRPTLGADPIVIPRKNQWIWFVQTHGPVTGHTSGSPIQLPVQNTSECYHVYQTTVELCYPHTWVKTRLTYPGISKNLTGDKGVEFDLVLAPCRAIPREGIYSSSISQACSQRKSLGPNNQSIPDIVYFNPKPSPNIEFKIMNVVDPSKIVLKDLVDKRVNRILNDTHSELIEVAPAIKNELNGFRISYVTQPISKVTRAANQTNTQNSQTSTYTTEIMYARDDRIFPLSRIYFISYEVPRSTQFNYLPEINSILEGFHIQ
jgi:hypothetical protein